MPLEASESSTEKRKAVMDMVIHNQYPRLVYPTCGAGGAGGAVAVFVAMLFCFKLINIGLLIGRPKEESVGHSITNL